MTLAKAREAKKSRAQRADTSTMRHLHREGLRRNLFQEAETATELVPDRSGSRQLGLLTLQ